MSRRIFSLILAVIMLFSMLETSSFAKDDGIIIDTDGTDGYEGDYIVIFNNAKMMNVPMSTGDMTGFIDLGEDDVGEDENAMNLLKEDDAGIMVEPSDVLGNVKGFSLKNQFRTSKLYEVGDTENFIVYQGEHANTYQPFRLLAIGDHCYIWTNDEQYSLDSLNEEYAEMILKEFDEKYEVVTAQFGEAKSTDETGRINILAYNIDDGWEEGKTYIGGFFEPTDYAYGITALHIDTYPTIYAVLEGKERYKIENTYNTMVHEFQHLINHTRTNGKTPRWLNECMSMATEELIYPGSAVPVRIKNWLNENYSGEHHSGRSLYDWTGGGVINSYGISCLFGQYIRSQAGTYEIFSKITEKFAENKYSTLPDYNLLDIVMRYALEGTVLEGKSVNEVNMLFRVALNTAYTGIDCGIYSFRGEEAFKALQPVIYKKNIANITSGGAITVSTLNGVYEPPVDADKNMVYIGIKILDSSFDHIVKFVDFRGIVISVQNVIDGEAAIAPENVINPFGGEFIGWDKEFNEVHEDMVIKAIYKVDGDANLDNVLSTDDATEILRYLAELTDFTDEQLSKSDITGDSIIDTRDASCILIKVAYGEE